MSFCGRGSPSCCEGRPIIVIAWTFAAENAYISLPVSPSILFVAANKQDIADALRSVNPTDAALKNNKR